MEVSVVTTVTFKMQKPDPDSGPGLVLPWHTARQRFRGGLVFEAHRLCVSLNSRLESNEDERRRPEPSTAHQVPAARHHHLLVRKDDGDVCRRRGSPFPARECSLASERCRPMTISCMCPSLAGTARLLAENLAIGRHPVSRDVGRWPQTPNLRP